MDNSLNIAESQRDMRYAYFGGTTGLVASATAWLIAGIVAINGTPNSAVITLFIGGIFIHPVAIILSKILGRPGKQASNNPLGALALESTFLLLLSLPIAYGISLYRIEWFFPAMLLIIGGRYFIFSTLYGNRLYWLCGATLALVAFLLVMFSAPFWFGAFSGAVIEYTFGALIVVMKKGR